jgi:hypothetical protein
VAGTEYVGADVNGADATEYEQHFNATEIANNWKYTPFIGIPIIGDIFSGFSFLWQCIGYLIDGFPTLLVWIGDSLIPSAEGQAAFTIIANVIRAAQALLIVTFLIEFISGRVFTDN